ncbi:MAG: sulfite exporter TauE/SafE family protein [Spirochaetales bacterium]|nr:sulfite exporter TauE/SafE family protein [Spirochaetales bacterium]
MGIDNLNIALAFAGGIIAFLSPCILPLIPSYISFISGESYNTLVSGKGKKSEIIIKTLFFILGFSILFVTMGLLFSGAGALLNASLRPIINISAGIIVVLLGINFIFDFIQFLNFEKKLKIKSSVTGYLGSFLLGLGFGAGWSPCVGPILSSILALVGVQGNIGGGVLLLIFFSLGLGTPFILTGVFFSSIQKQLQRLKKQMKVIKIIGGVFLIFVGILILMGQMSNLTNYFNQWASGLSQWEEAQPLASRLVFGLIFLGLFILFAALYYRKIKAPLAESGGNKEAAITNYIRPGYFIFGGVFLILAILVFTGVLSIPQLLSSWFQFEGI